MYVQATHEMNVARIVLHRIDHMVHCMTSDVCLFSGVFKVLLNACTPPPKKKRGGGAIICPGAVTAPGAYNSMTIAGLVC